MSGDMQVPSVWDHKDQGYQISQKGHPPCSHAHGRRVRGTGTHLGAGVGLD